MRFSSVRSKRRRSAVRILSRTSLSWPGLVISDNSLAAAEDLSLLCISVRVDGASASLATTETKRSAPGNFKSVFLEESFVAMLAACAFEAASIPGLVSFSEETSLPSVELLSVAAVAARVGVSETDLSAGFNVLVEGRIDPDCASDATEEGDVSRRRPSVNFETDVALGSGTTSGKTDGWDA
jgi:hypothetical protein